MSSGAHSPDPLRIALVGCGEVCEHKHLPALRRVRGAQVVAVADHDPGKAASLAAKFDIPHWFSSLDALFEAGVSQAVGILTPPGDHAAVALAALKAGCTILVEKPITLTLADAEARGSRGSGGRKLWLGRDGSAHALAPTGTTRTFRHSRRRGRDARISPGRLEQPPGDVGTPDWKRTRATGGGALIELGVHAFDLWRFLTDAEVFDVFAVARQGVRDDECALVTARLENGVLAGASLSERSSHDLEIDVAGDRGRLRIGCQRFDGFEQYGRNETDGMLGPRFRHLVDSVRALPGGLVRMRQLGDYAIRTGANGSTSLTWPRAPVRCAHSTTA